MTILRLTLVVGAVLIIVGCATPYKTSGLAGGYSEGWLTHNVAYVHFQGNGYTNRQRAHDFARLRAAELAIENDFEFVAFTDSENGGYRSSYQTPVYANTRGAVNQYGSSATINSQTTVTGGQTVSVFFPASSVIAVYMNGKDEFPDLKPVPAEILLETLKAEYRMTKPDVQEIRERPRGVGQYKEGVVYSEDGAPLHRFQIELGTRTGELVFDMDGTKFQGHWLIVSRGDSVADIAGEVESPVGSKMFARMDVVPGRAPSGVGFAVTEAGDWYKLRF
jgi:hypothetical protein